MVKNYHLIDTLLYFASDSGKKTMPFDWLILTSEIARALEEYLSGDTSFSEKFKDYRFDESFAPAWFEDSFNQWLDNLLAIHGSKLNPGLRDSFKETLTIKWVPKDGPSDGYNTNGVKQWHHDMIQMGHFSDLHGNFTWMVPEANLVANFIERELGEEACHHCQNIADLMKKHIELDLGRF